jgi:hypothetical protein
MADITHSTLSGAELHEPKGIATAGVDTVYVADGAGSGEFKSVNAVYGEAEVLENATLQAVTGAIDTSLDTSSDYVKTTAGLWTTGELSGVTFNATGGLDVLTTGTYEVSFWVTYAFSTSTVVAFKFSLDDTNTNLNTRKVSRKIGTGGDVGAAASSWYKALTAGDKISIFVAAAAGGNLTIVDAGLNIQLLKET